MEKIIPGYFQGLNAKSLWPDDRFPSSPKEAQRQTELLFFSDSPVDADFRFHVGKLRFHEVRRIDFLPVGFRQETMAYEEHVQVADGRGIRPPQSRMRVFFPSGRPIPFLRRDVVPENRGELPEEPPERRPVRPDRPVGDSLFRPSIAAKIGAGYPADLIAERSFR